MYLIESERLYARYFTMEDLDDYHRLNGDEEIMYYIRQPQNRLETAVFLRQIIDAYTSKKYDLRLALLEKDTHVFIGSFAIIPIDGSGELQLGYALLKEYWGKGYATEIVKAGLYFAFETLGLTEIAGVTEVPNTASQKVLLKNGFVFEKTQEGKKETYLYRCRNVKMWK